jgi:hypothetical protein
VCARCGDGCGAAPGIRTGGIDAAGRDGWTMPGRAGGMDVARWTKATGGMGTPERGG